MLCTLLNRAVYITDNNLSYLDTALLDIKSQPLSASATPVSLCKAQSPRWH